VISSTSNAKERCALCSCPRQIADDGTDLSGTQPFSNPVDLQLKDYQLDEWSGALPRHYAQP
jgi:hypothetical protein